MAIGADAKSVGYPVVPDTGEDGKVKYGAREINRTRDFVAQVWKYIPKGKPAWRVAGGITSGTGNPTGGSNGDIYFKVI